MITAGSLSRGSPSCLSRPMSISAACASGGLTFLQFLTTWEAVEHAGPGTSDQ